MGLGGISTWQLVILLLIIVLIFGTRRLRSIGGDLGSAVKGFKKGLEEEDEPPEAAKESLSEREQASTKSAEKV